MRLTHFLFLVLFCFGVSPFVHAKKSKPSPSTNSSQESYQSMNAPNPIKVYVHVIPQGGDGNGNTFMLCNAKNNNCIKPQHTPKHLAAASAQGSVK